MRFRPVQLVGHGLPGGRAHIVADSPFLAQPAYLLHLQKVADGKILPGGIIAELLPAVTWPQHPAENETDVLAFMPGEHDARRALRGKTADHVGIEFPGRGFRHAAVPHASF